VSGAAFSGFPGIARATAIPNVFFSTVLPRLEAPGDLLAFLWVARLVQEQRAEARYVTPAEVWAAEGASESFAQMAGGRPALERGLLRCVEVGALLSVRLVGEGSAQPVYFVNNPSSRRALARARAGELQLRPGTAVEAIETESRPGIFRLYEENIGTITPLVAERLLAAAEDFPYEMIEAAFREAAELNRRNWRYVERILQNWAQEGRPHETSRRDSSPGADRRDFHGGPAVARYR